MKLIKLLLTENVDNLGIVGDVVDVRPGYARNFLLPRGLATQPSAGNIKRLAARRAQVEEELKALRAKQEAMLEKLKGKEITLQRSANDQGILFGGVSQHEIAQALRDEGFEIDDRAIRIGQQIKRLDSYNIPVVLASDLKTEIKLWVVSDKPSENLQTEEAAAEEPAAEQTADEEKPARKSRKADKSQAPETPVATGEEKPRKKGKKAAAEPAAE